MPDLTPNNVTKVLVLGFESQVVHAAFVSLCFQCCFGHILPHKEQVGNT